MQKKDANAIILWGSAWGLAEATLGYVFHALNLYVAGIAGFFMFPIACYFLNRVYIQTGKLNSIIYTSSIAAAIKLTDLLIPSVVFIHVINPAFSMIIEGLAVFAALAILERKSQILTYWGAFVVCISWRISFVLLFMLPAYLLHIAPMMKNESLIRFFFVESLINGLIIYLYIRTTESKSRAILGYNSIKPAFSFSLLALAFFAQWMI